MLHTATHCTALHYAAPQFTTHGRMNTCAARSTEDSRAFRLQIAVCFGVVQCGAVCCSVVQRAAVSCSVLPPRNPELSGLGLRAESPRRDVFARSTATHCNTLQHTAAPISTRIQSVRVSACVHKVPEETSSRAPLLPRIRARCHGHRQETAGFLVRS